MKLSTELGKWRCDRPDEWKMDEFQRNAEKLEAERDALAAQVEVLEAQWIVFKIAAFNVVEGILKSKTHSFDDKTKDNTTILKSMIYGMTSQDCLSKVCAEREMLAAELEILAAFRDEVVGVINNSQGVVGWHHNHTIATWDELFPVVPDNQSPAACLAQVRAEAVKSLLTAGIHYQTSRGSVIHTNDVAQYAERIRQGGAE